MKKSKKKYVKSIIIYLSMVILIFISLQPTRKLTSFEMLAKDSLQEVNKTIINIIDKTFKTKQTDQTKSQLIQENILQSKEQEISELRQLLKLNQTLTDYEIENATVISRKGSTWFNTLTIDKGKSSNIKEGMAVITTNGLIGEIGKTTNKTSEVKLLTTSDVTYKTSVTVRIDGKDNYAILNGYDKNKKLLKVSSLDKNIKINKDEIVITSGLGKMPQGIYIGKVASTETDKYNLGQTIYIQTEQDFDNIHYVTVLREQKKWISY